MLNRITGVICCALCCGGMPPYAAAGDLPFKYDSWQERRLLEPTAVERQQERNGEVFIYDGLDYSTVQQALDQEFERIDNMMFVRTQHPPESPGAAYEVEEDGCD